MQIVIETSHEATSRRSAELIADEIRENAGLLFCAASGNSPTRTYELLGVMAETQPGLFQHMRLLKLDEWGGLANDDPATCETYLQKHLVQPLSISEDRYLGFQSDCTDPQAECHRLRAELDRHGQIDLCVLGMGVNGHVGFNEPASFLEPDIHVVRLTEDSLNHQMLSRAQASVRWGLTIGMADLMQARKVLIIINGQHKKGPFQRFLSRKITTEFPASLLWLHPNITCLCDLSAIGEFDGNLNGLLSGPHFPGHKAGTKESIDAKKSLENSSSASGMSKYSYVQPNSQNGS